MSPDNLNRLTDAVIGAKHRVRLAHELFDSYSWILLQEMLKGKIKILERGDYSITTAPVPTVECQGCKRPLDPPAGLPKEQPGRKLVIKKRKETQK